MSHPHVLITDYAWPSLDVERSILEPLGATLLVAERGDQDELLRLAPQADAILTCWRQIPVAVLEAATRCRLVCRYGIGLDYGGPRCQDHKWRKIRSFVGPDSDVPSNTQKGRQVRIFKTVRIYVLSRSANAWQ